MKWRLVQGDPAFVRGCWDRLQPPADTFQRKKAKYPKTQVLPKGYIIIQLKVHICFTGLLPVKHMSSVVFCLFVCFLSLVIDVGTVSWAPTARCSGCSVRRPSACQGYYPSGCTHRTKQNPSHLCCMHVTLFIYKFRGVDECNLSFRQNQLFLCQSLCYDSYNLKYRVCDFWKK